MAGFLANGYKTTLFGLWLATLNGLTLKLFKSNTNPNGTETAGTFTEANFTGYASQALNTFPAFGLDGSNNAASTAGVYTFTQTGTGVTNDIYGYYCVTAGGLLVFSERDPNAPFAMNATGRVYQVNITMTGGTASGFA